MRVFCGLPWTKIKVQACGKVSNCCFQEPFGNILEKPFEDLWNCSDLQEIRNEIVDGKLPRKCSANNCPYLYTQKTATPENCVHEVPKPGSPPTELELDMPNTWCNIGGPIPTKEHPACFMCPRSSVHFYPDDAQYPAVLEKMEPIIPGLNRFMLVGLGEIFWKGNLWTIFDRFGWERHKHRIHFCGFSNGTCLNAGVRKRLLESCPSFNINVSIDAASRDTYKKLRSIDAYQVVVSNVRDCLLDPKRTEYQRISPCYNINLWNIDEVEAMVKMWQDVPVYEILFSATHCCYAEYDNGLPNIVVNERNWRRFVGARDLIGRLRAEGHRCRVWNALEMDFEKKAIQRFQSMKLF